MLHDPLLQRCYRVPTARPLSAEGRYLDGSVRLRLPCAMLRLLGGLAMEGLAFRQPKPLLLLAYLATEGAQSRRHLAELFWPGEPRALRSLTAALVRLRQGVPGAVEADEAVVRSAVSSDVRALLVAIEAGDDAATAARYPGPFLAGFQLPGWGFELEEWVVATREYLAGKVQEAHLRLAEADAAEGRFRAAAERAERAYALPGAAAPDPEVLERFFALLVAGGSARARAVREEAAGFGIALALSRDEATARLVSSDHEGGARRSPAAARALPSRATSFVGRDPEQLELGRLLADGGTRLVTITGPGGIGKTRLALQVATEGARTRRARDGVAFVPLEALDDPVQIPVAIASVMGFRLPGSADRADELARELSESDALLVLDNYEHLLEGAALVTHLVHHCPRLRLLLTSRERLNLEGEHVFALQGLPVAVDVPDPAAAGYQDAVRLFVQRAMRTAPGFSLGRDNLHHVVRICALVEGSPLAIELAAGLTRVLPVGEIVAEIAHGLDVLETPTRDVPERQRSLRATFDYSWRLLSSVEQSLLRALAVFVGGFTRRAAHDVAGATIPVLMSLVDKSLLRVLPSGRFDLHPLLYAFTHEQLASDPEEHARIAARHARCYLELAEEAARHASGDDQVAWLQCLTEEHENVRAALTWLHRSGASEQGLRLATALRWYWHRSTRSGEGRTWLDALLSGGAGAVPSVLRAQALHCAGELASRQGDLARAQTLLEKGLAIMRAERDGHGSAQLLTSLGNVALFRGEYEAAWALHQRSLTLRRAVAGEPGVVGTLEHLGTSPQQWGELEAARAQHEE
jgi:predicted ATPase